MSSGTQCRRPNNNHQGKNPICGPVTAVTKTVEAKIYLRISCFGGHDPCQVSRVPARDSLASHKYPLTIVNVGGFHVQACDLFSGAMIVGVAPCAPTVRNVLRFWWPPCSDGLVRAGRSGSASTTFKTRAWTTRDGGAQNMGLDISRNRIPRNGRSVGLISLSESGSIIIVGSEPIILLSTQPSRLPVSSTTPSHPLSNKPAPTDDRSSRASQPEFPDNAAPASGDFWSLVCCHAFHSLSLLCIRLVFAITLFDRA